MNNNLNKDDFSINSTNVSTFNNSQQSNNSDNINTGFDQQNNSYQKPINNQNGKKKSIIIPVVVILVSLLLVLVIIIGVIIGTGKLMKSDTNNFNNQQIQDNNSIGNNETNKYNKNGSLLMAIDDVFTITGRGTVVTGKIERGRIDLNDEVEIVGLKQTRKTVVTNIESFGKILEYAEAGDEVGLLLDGVGRDEVERGQVISKPNSIKAIKKFDANVYVLSKEEGGRHTPFFNNYRPQFYFRTVDVTGTITLPDGIEMVMPGETVNMTIELTESIAMEYGTEFNIREGGRIVGNGTVIKIYK